jgi:hypothetical protein
MHAAANLHEPEYLIPLRATTILVGQAVSPVTAGAGSSQRAKNFFPENGTTCPVLQMSLLVESNT